MPEVKFSPQAIRDLRRVREFLHTKSPEAARRSGERIRQGVAILGTNPKLGRVVDDLPDEFREWLIEFGDSGYVLRYRITEDGVVILAIRHQKEAGYY